MPCEEDVWEVDAGESDAGESDAGEGDAGEREAGTAWAPASRLARCVGALAIGLFAAVGALPADAAEICRPPAPGEAARLWWDPCGARGSEAVLALPLPTPESYLVFRRVVTPGREVFSRCAPERRRPIFGDPDDPFAGEARRAVTGGFRDEDSWYYFLGAYELTVGQAASILALDASAPAKDAAGAPAALAAGLSRLAAMLRSQARPRLGLAAVAERYENLAQALAAAPAALSIERLKDLARPVVGLTPRELDGLAERYSSWCYGDGRCAAALGEVASFGGALGFVRLPSEIEWEYAARGGAETRRFDRALSVERPALRRHAALGGFSRTAAIDEAVIGVGRAPTPGGFFDLYGNVSELTVDYFSSENGAGKVGGRAARGGSFRTPHQFASSGMREEVALHAFDADAGAYLGLNRSVSVGARFAIGAVVKADEMFLRETREGARCAAREGEDPLSTRLQGLAEAATASDTSLGRKLRREAEDARRILTERTRSLCQVLAANLMELGRDQIAVWIQYFETAQLIRQTQALQGNDPTYYPELLERYALRMARLDEIASEYFQRYADTVDAMKDHGKSCFVDGFRDLREELEANTPSLRRVAGPGGAFSEQEAVTLASRHAFEAWLGAAAMEVWAAEFRARGEKLATPAATQAGFD